MTKKDSFPVLSKLIVPLYADWQLSIYVNNFVDSLHYQSNKTVNFVLVDIFFFFFY